mgnify:CR=1 FL=1
MNDLKARNMTKQINLDGTTSVSAVETIVGRSGDLEHKARRAMKYMVRAIQEHEPDEIFVGFSGGTDSLLCADLLLRHFPEAKIFHANTGIGLSKTRQYVRDICKRKEWDLVEIRAREDCGQDYEEIVMKHGFPGPAMHTRMYARLKERCVRELHRRYKKKRGSKIMLVTGIRHDESRIRAGYKNSIISVNGGVVWVNAFYWFTQQDKYDYIKSRDLEVNPVHKVIGMSGECLCGAYAHEGELDLIRIVEPETADYIEKLQERVMKKWPWGWEDSMPKWFSALKEGQTEAFYDWEESEYFQPMCVGCGK